MTYLTTAASRRRSCGLDVRAWKVRGDDDATYCTSYCARLAGAAFVAVEVAPEPSTGTT